MFWGQCEGVQSAEAGCWSLAFCVMHRGGVGVSFCISRYPVGVWAAMLTRIVRGNTSIRAGWTTVAVVRPALLWRVTRSEVCGYKLGNLREQCID